MLDHMGINVSDLAASRAFYAAVLAPLDFSIAHEEDSWMFFSRGNNDAQQRGGFVISSDKPLTTPIHFAFLAMSRAQVDAFYNAAIKAGGKDNGRPGIRERYHPTYYAAFIIDPDGHNIEAVCHKAE